MFGRTRKTCSSRLGTDYMTSMPLCSQNGTQKRMQHDTRVHRRTRTLLAPLELCAYCNRGTRWHNNCTSEMNRNNTDRQVIKRSESEHAHIVEKQISSVLVLLSFDVLTHIASSRLKIFHSPWDVRPDSRSGQSDAIIVVACISSLRTQPASRQNNDRSS